MLPEQLSNDVCSLKPVNTDEQCLLMCCWIKTAIINYQFKQCMIRSAARLTTIKLSNSFTNETFEQSLSAAFVLHKQLKVSKKQRGALDLNIGEPVLVFDKSSKVKNIVKVKVKLHSLIEEMMLIANICAADFLNKNYKESI